MHQIAAAVVDRLGVQLPEFASDHYPDAPARYPWGGQEKLLVSYESSTYGALGSANPMSVERTVLVSVTLVTRSLKGTLGVVETIDRVTRALFGWRPATKEIESTDPLVVTWTPLGCSPMLPTRDAFLDEDNGVWRWVVEFSTKTMVVEAALPLSGPPWTATSLTRGEESCA